MLATPSDAVREFQFNHGYTSPDVCWLVTPYDTIVRNPFYKGPDVPHPDEQEQLDRLTADMEECKDIPLSTNQSKAIGAWIDAASQVENTYVPF